MSERAVVGIFVGGRATRMAGRAKGLLRRPDGTPLVPHLVAIARAVGALPLLVGGHAKYEQSCVESLRDEPAGVGPIGGLVALLERAGGGPAIALACDMPFVTPRYLEALLNTSKEAAILAPRRERWEPLAARYSADVVLALARTRVRAGEHSLQGLLDSLPATQFEVPSGEEPALSDWDTEEDVLAGGGR